MEKEANTKAVAEQYPRERMTHILEKAAGKTPLKPDELRDLRAFFVDAGDLGENGIPATVINNSISARGEDTLTKEIMRAEIEHIKIGFGYANAPMLERLLIDQVCMCHHRMWIAEWRHTERAKMDDLTINQRLYDEKVLTMVQARYLKAVETLAKVRRLKLPAMQVNVAEAGAKQLNVAT